MKYSKEKPKLLKLIFKPALHSYIIDILGQKFWVKKIMKYCLNFKDLLKKYLSEKFWHNSKLLLQTICRKRKPYLDVFKRQVVEIIVS